MQENVVRCPRHGITPFTSCLFCPQRAQYPYLPCIGVCPVTEIRSKIPSELLKNVKRFLLRFFVMIITLFFWRRVRLYRCEFHHSLLCAPIMVPGVHYNFTESESTPRFSLTHVLSSKETCFTPVLLQMNEISVHRSHIWILGM